MLRTIVIILLALAVIAGGIFGYMKLGTKPEKERMKPPPVIKAVFAETIENGDIPLQLESSGQLEATRRVQLTAEVTGVLKASRFKEGVAYNQGAVIFTIDNAENNANLASQRSNYYAQVLNLMPDLRLDYPDEWQKWEAYLNSIDINQSVPALPEFGSAREKNFITASGLVAAYQSIKNMEIRSGKYIIRAPFNGVITEANVQEGGLVRMNQPLGEISSLGDYELELPVNISYLPYLKVGNKIELEPIEGSGTFDGEVVRINPKADVNSQSIIAYVRVRDKNLREGMYLKAVMDAGVIQNAAEINRKLINSDDEVFIIEHDTVLARIPVETVHLNQRTAIVKGIEDGTVLVSKPVPGAYPGMWVRILETESAE